MGLFDKLRRLMLGAGPESSSQAGRGAEPEPTPLPVEAATPTSTLASQDKMAIGAEAGWDEQAAEETHRSRERYWAGIGAVESDVLAHLISPAFMGGPAWPSTRQAFRVIRRDGGVILATDGLSDPFDGVRGGGNGFQMEIFIETPGIDPSLLGQPGEIAGLSGSWAFEVLHHVAGTVAKAAGITYQLKRHQVLSMEIPGFSEAATLKAQLPPGFVTEDDSLGLLIGAPRPDFPTDIPGMPLSPVIMVPIMLVMASELEFLRAGGAEARRELAARLEATPGGHRSLLTRTALA